MDLHEFQKKSVELLKEIDSKHKGEHDTDTTIVHLLEELGEVSRQLFNQKIGRAELDKENLGEEISDCMILLVQLAHNFDIDVENAVEAKLKKLQERFKI